MPAIIFGLFIFGAQAMYHAPEGGYNSKEDVKAAIDRAIEQQVVIRTQEEYAARYND